MGKKDPRVQNGHLRRKYKARFKAMDAPCHICGRPIRYDLPSTPDNPFSFVIDEIIPIKYWRQAGYSSPAACAQDFNNLGAAHRICNAKKGAKLNYSLKKDEAERATRMQPMGKRIELDGKW